MKGRGHGVLLFGSRKFICPRAPPCYTGFDLIHRIGSEGGTNSICNIGEATQVDNIGIEYLRQMLLMHGHCYILFRTVQ
jgi:hypothetical protein